LKKSIPPTVATAAVALAIIVEARDQLGDDLALMGVFVVFTLALVGITRKDQENED
jgi:hypothetical protein